MRILFDHGTPAPLQSFLTGHTVREAKAQGWDTFKNGDLLTAAEAAGFDVLVTTDKNIRYQQNLTSRTIAIVVLGMRNGPSYGCTSLTSSPLPPRHPAASLRWTFRSIDRPPVSRTLGPCARHPNWRLRSYGADHAADDWHPEAKR